MMADHKQLAPAWRFLRSGLVRRAPLVAAVLAFVLYAATLSGYYSADSLEYAMAVEADTASFLIDPFHLLLHPLGWAFCWLWKSFGWAGRALLPLQLLNSLGGAAAVGGMVWTGRRLGGSTGIAMTAGAGFGVSFGIWILSTQAEFVTIPLAVAIWLLGALLTASAASLRRPGAALALGLGTGVAVLTYLSSFFLLPVASAGFVLLDGLRRRDRLRQITLLLMACGLVVAFAFLMVAYLGVGRWEPGALVFRLTETPYGRVGWKDFPKGGYAFLRTLAGFPDLVMNDRTVNFLSGATWAEQIAFGGYYLLVLGLASIPLAFAWIRRRMLFRRHRRVLIQLGVWTGLYTAFGFFWVSGDISFWVPVLAAWWLLVGLVLSDLRSRRAGESREEATSGLMRSPRRLVAVFIREPLLAAAAAVLLLAVLNAALVVLPNRSQARNRWLQIALSVGERTAPGDLILTSGADRLPWYLIYFAQRYPVTVLTAVQAAGSSESGFAQLNREIARVREDDGHAYLVGVRPGRGIWWDVLAHAGVTPAFFDRFHGTPAWTVAGETIIELVPQP